MKQKTGYCLEQLFETIFYISECLRYKFIRHKLSWDLEECCVFDLNYSEGIYIRRRLAKI